jgi:hypothetical protein
MEYTTTKIFGLDKMKIKFTKNNLVVDADNPEAKSVLQLEWYIIKKNKKQEEAILILFNFMGLYIPLRFDLGVPRDKYWNTLDFKGYLYPFSFNFSFEACEDV